MPSCLPFPAPPLCLGLIRDWLFLEKSNMLFKPPWVLKRPFSPVSTTHNYTPNSGSPISQESKDPKRHSLIFCPNIIQARATKERFCRIRWFTDFKLCVYFLKFLIHLPRSCLHIPPPFIRIEALCKGHRPLLLRFQEFLLHLHILLISHTVDFALFGNFSTLWWLSSKPLAPLLASPWFCPQLWPFSDTAFQLLT